MRFTTYNEVVKTDLKYSDEFLNQLTCGLHRCPLPEAYDLLPELADLYDSVPTIYQDQYEIDVKIHMLMKGQYPCIPNWHCDNVPRDNVGSLEYQKADSDHVPMLIWISNGPNTEFMANNSDFDAEIRTHGQLASYISAAKVQTKPLESQTWAEFYMNTPHRGMAATENGWRVFARVTHKSILSDRPVISKVRRHCQVYLPHDFHW